MKRHFPDAPQGLGGGWGGVGGGWVAAIFTEVVPRATPAASRESHWAISYWLTRNRARIAAAAAAAASAAAAGVRVRRQPSTESAGVMRHRLKWF